MQRRFLASLSVIALITSAGIAVADHQGISSDNLGNGESYTKGEKKGWTDHEANGGHALGSVPKGLAISGKNGRVDNGKGNGGENTQPDVGGGTPNRDGEDGDFDSDPN